MTKTIGAHEEWGLTARQMACLQLFWSRKSAKEIGQELGISHHSVEKHLLACRERLGVQTSMEAARIVFGADDRITVRPYYDASEVLSGASNLQMRSSPTAHQKLWGEASALVWINRFGTGASLAVITAVAFGSICAVALLIAVGEGITQLGRSLGY